MVEANPNKITASAHHHLVQNKSVATGELEDVRPNAEGKWIAHRHGYKDLGTPKGASYRYWVHSWPDAQVLERYLEVNNHRLQTVASAVVNWKLTVVVHWLPFLLVNVCRVFWTR